MSILPQPLRTALNRLLPGSCLLCAADSEDGLFCGACTADLPRLAATRCPQCAQPTTHGERCGACLKEAPHFERTSAPFLYEFPLDRLVQALKYGHQLALSHWFAEQLLTALPDHQLDLIIPMPLHPTRLAERGFNQAIEIARPLSQKRSTKLAHDVLRRTRKTTSQAELPLKARAANVRGAFECTADLHGQRLLLIDDVMTTGSTLNEAARVLKLHGAASVEVGVIARALRR